LEIFERSSDFNPAKTIFASILGALLLAVLNLGRFVHYNITPDGATIVYNLKDPHTILVFFLIAVGPIYSAYLVRLLRISSTFLGFYLGISTVALIIFFADFANLPRLVE
jgi:hypothetical protein